MLHGSDFHFPIESSTVLGRRHTGLSMEYFREIAVAGIGQDSRYLRDRVIGILQHVLGGFQLPGLDICIDADTGFLFEQAG